MPKDSHAHCEGCGQTSANEGVRLQKYLARAGVESRRGAEDLIVAGRVCVNGSVVTKLGSKVDPDHDVVEVDGVAVSMVSSHVHLILNKPAGYVTTMDDPQGRPCVSQLVPRDRFPGLYHVGRLDRETRGLLLFTTDGELGHGLLHPSRHVDKTYLARVVGHPSEFALMALREGVELDDGPTAPADVHVVGSGDNDTLLSLTIHEGRTRQVRRMCAAVRHECIDLQRVSFGPLSLDGLEEGDWRLLDADEVAALTKAAQKQC